MSFIFSLFQSTLPGWGATQKWRLEVCTPIFQSTLPGWGATGYVQRVVLRRRISIHAPRMGSDGPWGASAPADEDFNPRSPDGERRYLRHRFRHDDDFNPRSPDGERPPLGTGRTSPSNFNPRSPDGERPPHTGRFSHPWNFNPRSPDGERRENGHLRPRYGQNHPFSTLIVSQIVVDVLGTVRKSQKTPAH